MSQQCSEILKLQLLRNSALNQIKGQHLKWIHHPKKLKLSR